MEPPKGRRDFKMATLDVTEKVNVLVDAIGWEGFCEELMARMDEDALDAVCDRMSAISSRSWRSSRPSVSS